MTEAERGTSVCVFVYVWRDFLAWNVTVYLTLETIGMCAELGDESMDGSLGRVCSSHLFFWAAGRLWCYMYVSVNVLLCVCLCLCGRGPHT